MKLSEFLSTGLMCKKAKLLKDITLNTGESMKAGTIGYVLKEYSNGYHFEINGFACKVQFDEVRILKSKDSL